MFLILLALSSLLYHIDRDAVVVNLLYEVDWFRIGDEL
jgi:hypothetical protein